MSVQRYISTSFWEDEWVGTLSISEKLLYLYFLTNPLTNIAGVYKITMRRILFDTGLEAAAVAAMLAHFAEDGKAYFREDFIIIPAWPSHQRLEERPSLKKGVDKILDTLSASMLAFLGEAGYRYDTPKISHKAGAPSPQEPPKNPPSSGEEPTYSDSDSDSDSDTDTDSDSDASVSKKNESDPRKAEIDRALAGILEGMQGASPSRAKASSPG